MRSDDAEAYYRDRDPLERETDAQFGQREDEWRDEPYGEDEALGEHLER